MSNRNDFLMNISSLYRYTQKYFDKHLADYNFGSGQLIFLLLVYENEGISMQKLTDLVDVDKGTTTKGIKKLLDEDYLRIENDESDKRVKRLYTTAKTGAIINDLYALRNEYVSQLMKDFGEEKAEEKIDDFGKITRNAHETVPEENYNELKFGGIQKLTLLDYPGQVACTLFTVGCNMKCPFCHNRDLVFVPENFNYLDPDDVLAFLEKRRGIIDAVCITGGEPLLQAGLLDFLKEVKELGYQIKVDTNGLYPEKLKEIVESGYVDYIAMDVKNSFGKYCETIGLPESEQIVQTVKKSMKYLLSDPVEYEFRTTVVRELHTKEDLKEIAKAIRNCKNYYLQQFVDSGKCIKPGYHSYDAAEMREMAEEVQKIIPNVQLRGV